MPPNGIFGSRLPEAARRLPGSRQPYQPLHGAAVCYVSITASMIQQQQDRNVHGLAGSAGSGSMRRAVTAKRALLQLLQLGGAQDRSCIPATMPRRSLEGLVSSKFHLWLTRSLHGVTSIICKIPL